MNSRYSIVDLKFEVLKSLSDYSPQHRINVLGRPFQSGSLESQLNVKFTDEERALSGNAIDELKVSGLIRPTYNDITDPENWLEITESGRIALSQRALDDLDVALKRINPTLCDLRDGASQSLLSDDPDGKRQAAHSMRELIRQVLTILAPTEILKAEPGFQPSKDGVTRRMRIRHIINKRPSGFSKSDGEVVEKTCDLIEALHDKLSGEAHRDIREQHGDIKDLVSATEIALRKLLL